LHIVSCTNHRSEIGTPTFSDYIVDDKIQGTASIYACDLDNDGDTDILGAALEDDAIICWRNNGGIPINWKKEIIEDRFVRAISVHATDIDGDKDVDVIGAAGGQSEISLWINEGNGPITWKKQIIRQDFLFAHEVYANDLDLDSDMDILGVSTILNRISWWENKGGNPIIWIEQTIDSSFSGAKSVRIADFDLDGDMDIVGAALDGNEIAWWSNNGDSPILWKKYNVDQHFEGAHRVQAIDMDNDKDIDILAAAYHGNVIAWWENIIDNPVRWKKHIITENFIRACIAYAADLDNDGDMDVVGSAQDGNEIAWWRNESRNGMIRWTKSHIDSLQRAWPVYCCDIDGDKDIDVIAGSGWKGINKVKLYKNNLIH